MRALIPVLAALCVAVFLPQAVYADSGQARTWNFAQATIPGAQALGNEGKGVTVAVIDTWVDYEHPDLRGRIAEHAVCVDSASGCRDNTYAEDRCAHGTHVAGTVVSKSYGVAPKAQVLAVQALAYDEVRGECTGSTEDVARAIRFAVGKGAAVINLSLGTLVPGLFSSDAVASAVADAARAGVVVVFAAGNNTIPMSDDYGSNALLVAATGPNGSIASYSTRGGSVSLAAPGGDSRSSGRTSCSADTCIVSTVPGRSFALLQGTSMAAPHVAGAAALLLSQLPERGREDVLTSLQSTARPLAGTQHGLIDATAALRLRKDDVPTTTTAAPIGDPDGKLSQHTEQRRPDVAPRTEPNVAAPRGDAGGENSRKLTFTRPPRPAMSADQGAGVDSQAGPPTDSAPRSDDGSGRPLTMLWGGLAAIGAITALVAVVGAPQRLRRTHHDP
ncbi:MAG: S8 family serine peptidase [Actinophytocola sp.]|nr:S8 family serine peptidase [Actinophytocola sp.]